ncbi:MULTISPECIES: signal peptide peptidase SppA [Alteribacter]|uniref:Signal peptide peptidase SppA n=1 Tax=Alteribacter keqinensis TaxID=2483800 RepID=A0A3M7TXQ0_9BACI|nr:MULTISPECIES: signal peptide peptidase SppA [Alteribacter]MBM7096430.1 signal peptide peptidase SppA [Alteribacter salitolerans]RNA70356.1 signal peptide peptidase SppA [Alteribacter keqinensis]
MSGKRWVAVGIAVALFMGSSFFSLAMGAFTTDWDDLFAGEEYDVDEHVLERGNGNGKIVVMHLNGVIQSSYDAPSLFESATYNHNRFLKQLDAAANDGSVDGIIISVNTPGGGVMESDQIHDKIVEIQEEYGKEIYISMQSMAASGGYYIAAPAAQVYAHPQTITGSIGVIMQSLNVAELAEDLGIQSEVIKSGPYKDIMSATREMTDDERQILQDLIDESYERFVDIISEGRDMPRDQVEELADGRIYSGNQAYEADLVDGLGDLDDVIEAFREDIGKGDIDVVEYRQPLGFPSLFGAAAQSVFGDQLSMYSMKEWIHQSHAPRLMYLYTN